MSASGSRCSSDGHPSPAPHDHRQRPGARLAVNAEIDPTALCEAQAVGSGSSVLAFARWGLKSRSDTDCVVGVHAVLDGAVTLADGVRCRPEPDSSGPVRGSGATIGANAVLAGDRSIDVGRDAVVESRVSRGRERAGERNRGGNPARILTYVDSGHEAAVRGVVTRPLCRPARPRLGCGA